MTEKGDVSSEASEFSKGYKLLLKFILGVFLFILFLSSLVISKLSMAGMLGLAAPGEIERGEMKR